MPPGPKVEVAHRILDRVVGLLAETAEAAKKQTEKKAKGKGEGEKKGEARAAKGRGGPGGGKPRGISPARTRAR